MGQLSEKVPLGRSNLRVSRLGLGSSYGAPTAAYEEAFERGVNYFYWGSRRSDDMGDAIRHVAKGRREDIVVVLQSYARPLGFLVKQSVQRGLRSLGLDYADVLLLGWYNDVPSRSVMDAALGLVERLQRDLLLGPVGILRGLVATTHRQGEDETDIGR